MVDRLIGVYNADGGIVGELRYVVGHLLGTTNCALCDITHSLISRKREWDRFAADLGTPFDLRHLNELTPDEAEAVGDAAPVVLAELDGRLVRLVDAAALEKSDGDVQSFAVILRGALAQWSPGTS